LKVNIDGICSQHLLATNGYLYNYTSAENFTSYDGLLSSLATYIPLISGTCLNDTSTFICNAVFVPCDLTTGEPRAICSSSCYRFSTLCEVEYDAFVAGLAIAGIDQLDQLDLCADTLKLIKKGFGAKTTVKGVECGCIGIWTCIHVYVLYVCIQVTKEISM